MRDADAVHFVNAGNLDALFDRTWLRSAMQTYTGEVFFSAPLHLRFRPFARDSLRVGHSSVTVGRTDNTLAWGTREAAEHCVRLLKRGVKRMLRR